MRRPTQAHPTLDPVHGPIHASWLNQIEIYFSIVQRKVLTPNDFPCLAAVAERLEKLERHLESIARPFEWTFTRADLNALVANMRDRSAQSQPLKLAARGIRVRTAETHCFWGGNPPMTALARKEYARLCQGQNSGWVQLVCST